MSALLVTASLLTALPVYGAGNNNDSDELTLTISKQPEYHMVIPSAIKNIAFGAVNTEIGDLIIYGDIGTTQKVTVTATKEDFQDESDAGNIIPFTLQKNGEELGPEIWEREDVKTQTDSKKATLSVNIPTETWAGKAPGTYNAKIIFSAVLSNDGE